MTLAALLSIKVLIDGQVELLPVITISLALVVLVANITGSMLPLLLRKLKRDPALISSPLITTVTDVVGLLVYLSVARWLLHL